MAPVMIFFPMFTIMEDLGYLPRVAFNSGGQPFSAIPLGLELSGHVTRFITDGAISGTVSELRPAISLPLSLGGSFEQQFRSDV